MFKERKNKAPYLKHYCRGMTDRQIAEITERRLQIARAPGKERRIIRHFMSDLLRCAQYCPEPDVMEFMGVWRKVKGGQRLWDALNPVPAPKKGSQSRSA